MVIVYESKTGFTKRYADMLATEMRLQVYKVKEISKVPQTEEIIFLGWLKAGKIQGFEKLRKYNVKAVCASGTGRTAELNIDTVIARNKMKEIPFFYLRGGCLPLQELKGMDKIMMSMFLKMLKSRKDKEESIIEAISHIENGYDGVQKGNLDPVIQWLNAIMPDSRHSNKLI